MGKEFPGGVSDVRSIGLSNAKKDIDRRWENRLGIRARKNLHCGRAILKPDRVSESPQGLPPVSDAVMRFDLRDPISARFPGDADATCRGTTLGKPLMRTD